MPAVVSDTSPLIYLSWVGQIDLLRRLYEKVWVPHAVWMEMMRGMTLAGTGELKTAVDAGWIRVENVSANARVVEMTEAGIGLGEAEAISLAAHLHAILIIDDLDGRRVARRFGVEMTGTLGVLVRAKRENYIPAVRPLILRLIQETNFRLSHQIIDAALADVGETLLPPKK